MNHVTEYKEYDESEYVGKPIDNFYFKNEKGDLIEITVFDNHTYTLGYFTCSCRDYKRIDLTSMAANVESFKRIAPDFEAFLIDHLKKYYEL